MDGARIPFEARCAELAAGNEGAGTEAGAGAGSERVNEGTVAPGVLAEEGMDFPKGGGGGGIAFRSSCSFAMTRGGGIAFWSFFSSVTCVSSKRTSWFESVPSSRFVIVAGASLFNTRFTRRTSHGREDQEEGGCR